MLCMLRIDDDKKVWDSLVFEEKVSGEVMGRISQGDPTKFIF